MTPSPFPNRLIKLGCWLGRCCFAARPTGKDHENEHSKQQTQLRDAKALFEDNLDSRKGQPFILYSASPNAPRLRGNQLATSIRHTPFAIDNVVVPSHVQTVGVSTPALVPIPYLCKPLARPTKSFRNSQSLQFSQPLP